MTSLIAATSHVDFREPLEALRFDAFSLFPRRRSLLQNDEPVPIGGRAFDLLVALALNAGEIVSHAALIDAVWPKRVVSACNLKTQVGTLQKVLGPAPDGARYIKNVALRGYVFVADVHVLSWPGVRPGSPVAGGEAVAERRGELEGDAGVLEYLPRVGDLGEEVAGGAIARTDEDGVRHDDEDVLEAHGALLGGRDRARRAPMRRTSRRDEVGPGPEGRSARCATERKAGAVKRGETSRV
jgi:DNA-binding winged helix-turn-helix (wHTH) protein